MGLGLSCLRGFAQPAAQIRALTRPRRGAGKGMGRRRTYAVFLLPARRFLPALRPLHGTP
nr:MAG TPA: hypothetical protein [Inoviridae sp.]